MFEVTGTDGGWVPGVGALAGGHDRHRRRARCAPFEFDADGSGDWAFHCHKSHHTMNAMGHDVPTMIGVDHAGLAKRITQAVPDYMVMGERGMADMGEMEMPLPDNTLPMMTGDGPFGPLEMGGMFTGREGARRKTPSCGCCGAWVEHMKAAGFSVNVTKVDDTSVARRKYGLPDRFGSCHTAVVGGYVVEGHVPANDVKKLLAMKPVAVGLAVPGMPVGSPGMEMGSRKDPYQVLLVAKDGRERAFSNYN
jgi:hypothetical protein